MRIGFIGLGNMEALARGWGDKASTSPWMLQEEAAGVTVRETK
jgi:hypothetical protein